MSYMLDTNICIFAIAGKPTNAKLIAKIADHVGEDLCISSITLSELEYGVMKSSRPDQNRKALYGFLSAVPVVDYDGKAAKVYGEIRADLERKGTPVGAMDCLIAAHARSRGDVLVTNNVREFSRVDQLQVEDWKNG